jgi:glycosyltransferase involved in cell wall biosynthesis
MKILHLDTRPDWRGGQLQILLTMRGLRKRGYATELMAFENSRLLVHATEEGFPVHANSPRRGRWTASRNLRKLLAGQSFEIVHAHDANALTVAWLAGAHRQAALIAARRVAYPLGKSMIRLARYRAARRIIAVSEYVARGLITAGLSPKQVSVVHDGVELPSLRTDETHQRARQCWQRSPSDILVGCVGYLLPEKGQELLLSAMPHVLKHFSDCRLLLAGDGPCRTRFESLAQQLGITQSVLFAGFVEEVDEVYRALDVFVFPSLEEPLGSSLLAAMAHGLPVVAVASGGVPEIVKDGGNGVLAPAPPKAEQLAAAITELLRNPERARRLGRSARETIAARFTTDHLVEKTIECYRDASAVS